jgi:hypothetical protein
VSSKTQYLCARNRRPPIFTSDGLDLYFYAITAHFGQWITDVTTGKTRWQVALDLLYGQVNKSYRRRRLARVERRMRLGDLAHLRDRLKALGFSGTLNTAFVERINLTLRHALAALSRRCWATAQLTGELLAHLEWWRAYPQGAFGLITSAARTCRYADRSMCRKRGEASRPHASMARARRPWRPV